MSSEIFEVFLKTDWALLAKQKQALVTTILDCDGPLQGLLHWIDAIQDAAKKDGFPVVFPLLPMKLQSDDGEE